MGLIPSSHRHFPGIFPEGTLRSERVQNEKSPNVSNFRPEFCSESCSEFPPKFSRIFVLCFLGNGDHKKFTTNIPAILQCQSPGKVKTPKNNLERGQAREPPKILKKPGDSHWTGEKNQQAVPVTNQGPSQGQTGTRP